MLAVADSSHTCSDVFSSWMEVNHVCMDYYLWSESRDALEPLAMKGFQLTLAIGTMACSSGKVG